MSKVFKLIIFFTLIGLAKAGHRLILLVALGLGALIMLHILAQDWNIITHRPPTKKSFLFKRSIDDSFAPTFKNPAQNNTAYSQSFIEKIPKNPGELNEKAKKLVGKFDEFDPTNRFIINWEKMMKSDPFSCTRSFVCQAFAKPKEELQREEENILGLIEYSLRKSTNPNSELKQMSIQRKTIEECYKLYRFCPYSNNSMLKLLRLFA